MRTLKKIVISCLVLTLFLNSYAGNKKKSDGELTPCAKITCSQINEASGIVKSRRWDNVYWVHNDSGDKARIFAINREGDAIIPSFAKEWYEGISIPDAVNVDWEDIACDNAGNLYIADTGNNENMRTDLCIYVIREPFPQETAATSVLKKYFFRYPDQKSFPPEKKNFDCEALFWAQDNLYILTKHRSDKNAKLYRIEMKLGEENPAVLIGEFNIGGRVTGADCSPDGKKLAVLSYKSVWIFEKPDNSENFFMGKKWTYSYDAKDCEGVCIDGDTIRIVSEDRSIYEIDINLFSVVQ